MRRLNRLIGLAAFFSSIVCNVRSYGENWYKAGVVEYGINNNLTQFTNLDDEIAFASDLYINIIGTAQKEGVDILVFPELGKIQRYFGEIPSPSQKIVPCLNNTGNYSKILQNISCAVQNAGLYVVIKIFEEVEYVGESSCNTDVPNPKSMHTTNVVFDRIGMVVARYRKSNLLISEKASTYKKPEVELSIFETEFGRFGTFICYDLMHSDPSIRLVKEHNVTDVVFTTSFKTSNRNEFLLPMAAGWARVHDVNFLASGWGSYYTAGSGIFAGSDGPFSLPPASMIQLIIAKVEMTKCRRNTNCSCESKLEKVIPFTKNEKYETKYDETQSNFKKIAKIGNNAEINGEYVTTTLYYNSDNFNCSISFSVRNTSINSYSFFGSSAQEEFLGGEYCGIMKIIMEPSNKESDAFTSLEVKTTSTNERIPWPITFTLNQRLPLTGSAYEFQTTYSEGIRMSTMQLINMDEDFEYFYLLNFPKL